MKNLFVFALLSVISFSCQKGVDSPNGPASVLPTISTTVASSIANTTAVSGGNISSDGGATVTARGVCWGTSPGPAVTGNHSTDGNGTGIFVSSLTGLIPTTTYYIRAYATNSAGTAYGNELNFTTIATTMLPTVSTTAVTAVTASTAASGGNVTSDGGAPVTARGICWSTASNPVATGNHTTDGAGTGTFASAVTGLTANTLYYARAYATNSIGTAYGNEVIFTTMSSTAAKIFYNVENFNGTFSSYEIYSANLDGSNEQKLTNFSNNGTIQKWAISPSFNEDSTKIIFALADDNFGGSLMMMNLDGTNVTPVAASLGTKIHDPYIYQNGQKLLFWIDTTAGPNVGQIFTANMNGTNLVKLTSVAAGGGAPDGSCIQESINKANNTIIYYKEAAGIYAMNVDGSNKHQLVASPPVKDRPKFSPDGTKIVFSGQVNSGNSHREVFIMNADGSNVVQLTNYSNNGALLFQTNFPVFSKDGNTIYYTSDESGTQQIYKMNMDGTGKTKITTGTLNRYRPLVN